jgi:hypothetical protein
MSLAHTKAGLWRTAVAGVTGGVVFCAATFIGFVLIGTGLDHQGVLLDPSVQSGKLIAVWTELEPLPRFQTVPHLMLLGYVLFGIGHAFVFRSVAAAWPAGIVPRAWRLAALTWGLSYLFFEFLGPFNLLGEPMPLVLLELLFWAAGAVMEALAVVWVLERTRGGQPGAPGHLATPL